MTSTRDSRAEARKAWGRIDGKCLLAFPVQTRRTVSKIIIDILESLARREYEAGLREQRMRALHSQIKTQARRRG